MSVGLGINETHALGGGLSLIRGYPHMCEPDLKGSSKDDLYVLGGTFKEAIWLNEGAGVISD